MSEMSELYKIPTPQEVDELLRGDYAVGEAAPKNAPVQNSKVMEVQQHLQSSSTSDASMESSSTSEVGDRIFQQTVTRIEAIREILIAHNPPVDQPINAEEWRNRVAIAIARYFDDEPDIENDDREQAYRDSIREVRKEAHDRVESLSKLITRLYLDLWYIEQVAAALMQVATEYPPDNLKAIASLITHQCMGSRTNISSHTETDHYPHRIFKDERTTVNPIQAPGTDAGR